MRMVPARTALAVRRDGPGGEPLAGLRVLSKPNCFSEQNSFSDPLYRKTPCPCDMNVEK